jgi:hypothetical protein
VAAATLQSHAVVMAQSHAVVMAQSHAIVMPPRRPNLQASAERALYFSDPAPWRLQAPAGAFDRLKAAESVPTDD